MKDKISSIITALIAILMIVVFIIIGYIVYIEIKKAQEFDIEEFRMELSNDDSESEKITTPEVINIEFNGIDNTDESSKRTEEYNSIEINRYFYNQLEDESKYIYRAFEVNKEEMKTGTAKIEFGDYFTNILKENGGDEKLGSYYQSAIEAYTYDNPEVFYISPNKMYLTIETTTSSVKGEIFNVYINPKEGEKYLIDEFSSKDQINNTIEKLRQIRSEIVNQRSGDTLKDIKMVHDYLIDTITYDTTLQRENTYNICGALINKCCVCEGYARAFKYIMDEMGIPSVIVIGTGTNSSGQTENHAWNYVQYNNKWYPIDVTWDDPIIEGGGNVSNDAKVKYFMRPASEFNQSHSPNGQFTSGGKVFRYPDIV